MKKFVFLLSTLFLVFLFAASAHATPTLMLDDGAGNSITIVDGGVGDASAAGDGIVAFNDTIGGDTTWTVNITTGITKPLIGSADEPRMDLNSVNVSSVGAGTLTITFSETDFAVPPVAVWNTSIGGTTDNTVSLASYYDNGNTALAKTTPISSLGPFNVGAFSDDVDSGLLAVTTPFSLTLEAIITHTGAQQISSFNSEISPVPEPGTVILFGIGLIGLAGIARKKFIKK